MRAKLYVIKNFVPYYADTLEGRTMEELRTIVSEQHLPAVKQWDDKGYGYSSTFRMIARLVPLVA